MVGHIANTASPSPLETTDVLGLPLHLSSDYVHWILEQLRYQQGAHVVTLNAEMAMQAETDPALATVIQQAELVVPDGAGVVLYLRMRGRKIARCPGIELAETVLEHLPTATPSSAEAGVRPPSVFFFGGAPGVTDTAAELWRQRVPELAIAGTQHGYLSDADQDSFLQTLQALQPAVILVGMGVPRQEFWIAQNRHLCPHSIWIGVGGSFDIWAGTKERAPEWLRNNHLEWSYRLYKEPWRWRRMLALPQFAWRSLRHRERPS
jgi:N-acetylglucosaminyldiphosphoundecaprenol N-acetyl-beta-D-mannosaminyltransferase